MRLKRRSTTTTTKPGWRRPAAYGHERRKVGIIDLVHMMVSLNRTTNAWYFYATALDPLTSLTHADYTRT